MLEQIRQLLQSAGAWSNPDLQRIGLLPQVLLLTVSFLAALLVSVLYLYFYSGRETGSRIHRSFPLLGLAITGIFICIQFSLPLSLGLLGALSIVRFRTPIKEPEEIGFLMLIIATSIAAATFNLAFVGVFLLLAIVAILLSRLAFAALRDAPTSGTIILALKGEDYDKSHSEILATLSRRVRKGRLDSISRSDGRVVVTYSFRSLSRQAAPELESELRGIVEPVDATFVLGR